MKDRIKAIRELHAMSQKLFSEKIGITRQYLSLLETGEREPSDLVINAICREFAVNRQWLETGEGERLKVQESASLIPRLQRILQDYPLVAKTLEAAMEVMRPEDFDRMTEIIQQTVETLKNARG